MPNFNEMIELNIGLLVFAILVTFFILLGCVGYKSRNLSYMRNFVWIVCMNLVMLIGECGLWIMKLGFKNVWLTKLFGFFSYGGGAIMALFYLFCILSFVEERGAPDVSYRSAYLMRIVCGCYLVLVFLSMFNGMLFQVDAHGNLTDGPYYWIAWLIDPMILLIEILVVVHYRKNLSRFGTIVMLNFGLVSLLTTGLQSIWYPVPELLACTLALLLMFMLFYWEMAKNLVENERELMQSQMSLAISQIQPHFLYNTLSTIAELCRKDSAMAEEVTNRFALYLRGNLEHMGDSFPVEFSKELKHVQTYLWIEKIRFQEELQVVYDIQTEDFIIPALTVQPLVENAVKHGLGNKKQGGTVLIATREDARNYYILVKDDGTGFDVEGKPKDGRTHVGIENTRKRIETMCEGTYEIESEIGVGTTVTITIPKKKSEYEPYEPFLTE